MSDFRAVLDEEIAHAVDESIKKNHAPKKKSKFRFPTIANFFSVSSFLKTLTLFLLGFAGLLLWVFMNAEKTHSGFKDRLASKTVTVERDVNNQVFITTSPMLSPVSSPSQKSDTANVSPITENTYSIEPEKDTDQPLSKEYPSPQPSDIGALTPAPVPGLYESLPEGIIPKARLEDGMTPFKAYKKPFTSSGTKPKISLVAVNVGLSRTITQEIIRMLPAEISLGFSPYAPNIKLLSDAARAAGHETWLMLPLQNENYPLNDPGPATLLTTASIEQNQARLLSVLGRAVGYVGLIPWENHIYSHKDSETSSVIPQIFGRGLAILDSSVSSDRDFGRRIAYSDEFPFLKNNFWLDQELTKDHSRLQFNRLQDLASARGEAVMLFHPYPKSIKAVRDWLKSPSASQFELVPASHLAVYKDE